MSTTPLLFLPGLLCDAAVWAPQMAALGRNAMVAAYGSADTLGEMAEIALAAAPPGRFALAGHSMGGRVAFEVLRRAPERVERLALLDTGIAPLAAGDAGETEKAGRLRLLALAREQGMRAMAADWAQGMVHESRLGGPVFEAVLDMFERRTADIFAAQIHALLHRPDATPLLAGIACPTLVLTGEHDRWSPPDTHRRIQAGIPGSRLVLVPGSGHMTTMEEPAAVTAALAAWLSA
ncbi:MAG: alpha/beta fold hydrolase [Rubrivivax sp.]|nr:alpha/beta fold hydrolase [Rubrivivax sp.]